MDRVASSELQVEQFTVRLVIVLLNLIYIVTQRCTDSVRIRKCVGARGDWCGRRVGYMFKDNSYSKRMTRFPW